MIQFDSYSQACDLFWFPIWFSIDYFDYISGTVHATVNVTLRNIFHKLLYWSLSTDNYLIVQLYN